MKLKKILASIVSLVMVSQTMMIIPISAEDTSTEDTTITTTDTENTAQCVANWDENNSNTLVITVQGDGNAKLTVDDIWNGNITKDRVYNLIINEGVIEIGENAFQDCENLESVQLPKSILNIDKNAFRGCSHLTDINLKETENLVMLGRYAFSGTALTEVTLPDSVKFLGIKTHYVATTEEDDTDRNIKEVQDKQYDDNLFGWTQQIMDNFSELGSSFEEIFQNLIYLGEEGHVFDNCKYLTTVHLPKDCNYIPIGTFQGCTSLTTIGDVENQINFPDSVLAIGSHAFYGCTSITDVNIPDTVLEIQDDSNSGTVPVDGGKIDSDKGGAFVGCTNLKTARLSDSLDNVPMGIFYNCTSLESVNIPKEATAIGCNSFYGCTSLNNIVIPDTVTEIDTYTFYKCKNLTDITLSNNIQTFKSYCFQYSGITQVNMPNTVEKVGSCSFDGCKNLAEVTLSENLTNIDAFAFRDCQSLSEIVFPDGLTSIGRSAFQNCTSLTEIVIPDSCTDLGISNSSVPFHEGAFKGCTSLEKVTLPNGLATISSDLFMDCTSLSDINIPNTVRNIDNQAFRNCTSLTEVTLPDKLYTMGSYAFAGSGIKSIILPESLESLDEGCTFEGCQNLESVIFPETVKFDTLPCGTLAYCPKLKEIIIPNGIKYINSDAINSCENLETIVVPEGVINIGMTGFCNLPNLQNLILPKSANGDNWLIRSIQVPILKDLTMFSYTGSYGETLAKDNNIKFVSLDNGEDVANTLLMKKYILGITTVYHSEFDINQDGKINIVDVVALENKMLNQ